MLSIAIPSIDDSKFNTTSQMYTRLLGSRPFEIIRISDAKSMSEAYNRGMRLSKGEHVLLCHDDLEILSDDFADRFFTHLDKCDILGLAGTNKLVGSSWIIAGPPYIYGQTARPRDEGGYTVAIYNSTHRYFGGMQALDGVFLAMHRSVAQKLQFDEIVFDGFHVYDTDFTYMAYLSGLRLGVATDIQNLHASGGTYDEKWKQYARRFTAKYAGRLPKWKPREFNWNRILATDKQMIVEIQTSPTWEPL